MRERLFATRTLRAFLQIVLAGIVELLYRRSAAAAGSPSVATILFRFVEIVLFLYPLVYFCVPLLTLLVGWIVIQLKREQPEYPCPVCGYDIRETPHRCPECGTKLRWGQLP